MRFAAALAFFAGLAAAQTTTTAAASAATACPAEKYAEFRCGQKHKLIDQ